MTLFDLLHNHVTADGTRLFNTGAEVRRAIYQGMVSVDIGSGIAVKNCSPIYILQPGYVVAVNFPKRINGSPTTWIDVTDKMIADYEAYQDGYNNPNKY